MKIMLPLLAALSAPALAQAPLIPLPAPQVAAASDAFVWKFAPPVGSRWRVRSFSRAREIVALPAMPGVPAERTETNAQSRVNMDYDVVGRDSFGATSIRVTYRQMSSDARTKINGEIVGGETIANAGKTLDGASFVMKVAPSGQIWNVTGIEAALEKLTRAEAAASPEERAIMQGFNKSLSGEGLQKMMSSLTGAQMPPHPMRVGESWPYQIEMPVGLPIQLRISGTRTLKALDGGIASIAERMTLGGGSMKVVMPDGGTIGVDMSRLTGAFAGTTRVEASSGLALESQLDHTMSGAMTVTILDAKGAPQHSIKVPIDAKGTTRMVMEPR